MTIAELPQDFTTLAAVVLLLGMKHGFDADHLATIDGLTRYNARTQPQLARLCGSLFSLGHGLVVVMVALTVSALSTHWQVPVWLELVGAWVSIVVLGALGLVNLHAVLHTAADEVVRPVGIKGKLLGAAFQRLSTVSHPLLIMAVGALFAVSFDTLSQAALFALTGSQFGGWQPALLLGMLFMLGMLITDGVNGLWISRLISGADELARIASRVMGLAVASVCLCVATFGILRQLSPLIRQWSEGKELVFGAAVVGLILYSFWLARRLAAGAYRTS
ncbi:HoxN/HupN/NixA family nickel/cobalt transporter [Sinimarinibacterium sp. CAU 1509]|uniref:HoxN/HupN/NixA family nickel/cobalt transporter n=1 Tax=Sinimarinibacterium sp. CAU 1509 TaxID=2562283 RepID=UPI00200A82E5|nr:nickel transporter [Sinimarinibacterium sp. CAU 1509]